MPHTLMLIPTGAGVGLITVATGVVRAFENHGARAGLFKPVNQQGDAHDALSLQASQLTLSVSEVETLLSENRKEELLENIIAAYEAIKIENDIIIVQGLIQSPQFPYAEWLNNKIAQALSAKIIVVTAPGKRTPASLIKQIEIAAASYGPLQQQMLGFIVNKIQGIVLEPAEYKSTIADNEQAIQAYITELVPLCKSRGINVIGYIPWSSRLTAPRAMDIARYLQATIVNEGEMATRRIKHMTLCARSLPNIVDALQAGNLIITAGDRADIILATAMASFTGIQIAALVLTGNYEISAGILQLCQQALKAGLPIFSVASDSFRTTLALQNMSTLIPEDDVERLETVKNHIAGYIAGDWMKQLLATYQTRLLSPAAFRYQLVEQARKAEKCIVLPEGNEPRTLKAASICAGRGIVRCILLGDPEEIKEIALNKGIKLPENIEIRNPKLIAEHYVDHLVQARKNKGMTEVIAREQLKDNVMLATMMLELDEVDGLVSGAVHTTANTIRPALQIIKAAPEVKLVSSVFFMCLPDQVLVYGDCAINPNPNEEELADIAIQSASSAALFGIEPRIAMISYSTGTSGVGIDVEKIRKATAIVKERRPDLIIDGPLQYDAAFSESVAKAKAPDSPVAGKATVFIFPELNTGNTTYKAVQRSADVICIGPMLQGLRKPVNDLSRGATVDDIVYTIALTAIQANQITR